MKTKAVLSAIVTLIFSLNIYASEPVILKSEKTTEFGKQVEQTTYVDGTSQLDKRFVSNYNHSGELIEKTFYKWTGYGGWMPIKKLEYNYNNESVLATITQTNWNDSKKDWNVKSQITKCGVNSNGLELVAGTK